MAATVMEKSAEADAGAEDPPARRLASKLPADGLASWLWTLAITAFAFGLRLNNLSFPGKVVFDEVYYKKDAANLLDKYVELNAKNDGPGFVVHPPLGKWCIALGEQLFGGTPFSWRISSVVAGTLSVLIMVRLARRLFGSTLLGCIAGALLALDGLHFVSSRVALLDIFLMLFVLASFTCLVLDRDARRTRIRRALDAGRTGADAVKRRGLGGVPWWRIASAVLLGCALGVKWSAIWYLVPMVMLAYWWDARAVRSARVRLWWLESAPQEIGMAVGFVALVVLTYLATWTGWFISDSGWDRHWAEQNNGGVLLIPDALTNLWHYHKAIYTFHENLKTKHPYQSTPYSWLFLGRPVAYYYEGGAGCGAPSCSREIIALGNPALWWVFVPALVATAWRWLARRDWRAAAILLMVTVSIVPWTFYPDRTMFFFYALPALPFLVLAVTMSLGMILGPRTADRDRRVAGAILVSAYLIVVAIVFWYFHPILTGQLITYDQWQNRMWLDSWV